MDAPRGFKPISDVRSGLNNTGAWTCSVPPLTRQAQTTSTQTSTPRTPRNLEHYSFKHPLGTSELSTQILRVRVGIRFPSHMPCDLTSSYLTTQPSVPQCLCKSLVNTRSPLGSETAVSSEDIKRKRPCATITDHMFVSRLCNNGDRPEWSLSACLGT